MKNELFVLKPMYCRFVVANCRASLIVPKPRSMLPVGSLHTRSSVPELNASTISSMVLNEAREISLTGMSFASG